MHHGIVRFRLAGTRVCAILGRELRESGFADIWDPAVRHRMRLAADTVLANRKGLEIAVTALDVDGGTLDLEMLMLPLFSRSDRCDRIFGSLAAFQTLPPVESQFRVLYPADLLFEPAPPPRASHPRHDPRPLHPGARAGHLTVLDGGRRD